MVKDEPRTPWTDYREKAGNLPYSERYKILGADGMQLWKLKPNTPDEVKQQFEQWFTNLIRHDKEYYVPEMKDPYYTWEGKVVERSSLKGRELPLAE